MKILIIGATGQIGYALLKRLSMTDNELSVMVRDKRRLHFPHHINVLQFERFDIKAFRNALSNIEHVIYCAGIPEQFLIDDTLFEKINFGLLNMFLDVLRKTDVNGLTYISTYGVFKHVNGVIYESEILENESHVTPYFISMINAYRVVNKFAMESGARVTTIHPSAVYGGLNTGYGITNYMENLLSRNIKDVPFIFDGRFPVVHVDSLSDGIIKSFGHYGSFIISDQMTTLKEISLAIRKYSNSYVPMLAPVWLAKIGAYILEGIARARKKRPIISVSQVQFITMELEPKPDKAVKELGWNPMTLDEGILRFIKERG